MVKIAEPTIKAKLVLVGQDGGVSGGGSKNSGHFTKNEERLYRLEQTKASRALSKFLPGMAGSLMALGSGIAGAITTGLAGIVVSNIITDTAREPEVQEELAANPPAENLQDFSEDVKEGGSAVKDLTSGMYKLLFGQEDMKTQSEAVADTFSGLEEGFNFLTSTAQTLDEQIPGPFGTLFESLGVMTAKVGTVIGDFDKLSQAILNKVNEINSAKINNSYSGPNALTRAVVNSGRGNALTNIMVANASTSTNGVNGQ